MCVPSETLYPTPITLTIRPRPEFWLIIGVFLLSAILLIACDSTQSVAQPSVPPATVIAAISTPTPTPLPSPVPADPAPTDEAIAISPATDNSAQDSLPKPEIRAKIGKITFAAEVTDQHEAINPSLLFPQNITEVHAIFDYSDMSPAYTWERIWLLNDKEVARKADLWTGPENGVFDYFIDNKGRPLPSGDWVLEIYVEDKLLSLGAFVIEEPAEAGANVGASQ